MKRLLTLVLMLFAPTHASAEERVYDVVVYGGSSAGVAASVQVARMGRSVALIEPSQHLGGLTSGGLGWTDSGNKAVIGGIAREFYQRVKKHYDAPQAWRYQKPGHYDRYRPSDDAMWTFEPHVAERIFDELVTQHGISVVRNERLDRQAGVQKQRRRIVSITTESGRTFHGRMFIDATYEGDLMAAAGVSYHVGREATSVYDEKWNGVQTGVLHHSHWFQKPVDPYVVPGDPASGLLPRISPDPPGEFGAADHRVQAYCFRMCLTNAPENRLSFPKPAGYDPRQYELLLRVFDTGWREVFHKFDAMPNRKTDTNNHGPFSTDNIGMNYDYPEASYERRREIIQEHETYQQGLMFFVANDPRVPADIRQRMSQWGLAKDEFLDNGHWPHQIYVREARRMIGSYVMTENELLKRRPTPNSVGMGSYTMDSHNVQRYVTPDGLVQNEGDIGVGTNGPYEIAYGSLVPKTGECENLLVPVCVSSSHIAFGSIRMEPVFMILGQSSATAACQAIDDEVSVQEVDYEKLSARLLADNQVLEWTGAVRPAATGLDPGKLPGIVVDDTDAVVTGAWLPSRSVGGYVGTHYLHDNNEGRGDKGIVFAAKLENSGRYEVRLAYTANPNRASNVNVLISHADGDTVAKVDQRQMPPIQGSFVSLGVYNFQAGDMPTVSVFNEGADGHVIADAVQWLPLNE